VPRQEEQRVLGRRTYQGLSAGYTSMPGNPFVDRMNSIPKYVASRTLTELIEAGDAAGLRMPYKSDI
jgi:hypothetical protein